MGAEVEVVFVDKIFMTCGRGEVDRACRAKGALDIHFEYDGASTLFFKVFDKEGRRLECCLEGGRQEGAAVGIGPAAGLARSSSNDSGDPWWSSDSPELVESSEMSGDNYVPPSSRRSRNKVAAFGRRR